MPVLRTCRCCCGMSDFKQTTNQRDGSFGLYMPKANQKNRPFGCTKAVFYVFDSIHDSATMRNLSPEIFHWTKKDACTFWGLLVEMGKMFIFALLLTN